MQFYQKNDTNNNFQYSSQTINFSNDSPECSGDLYDGKASNSSAGDGEEAVKREETITEVKRKPFECVDCGKCFSQLRNYKYHRFVLAFTVHIMHVINYMYLYNILFKC